MIKIHEGDTWKGELSQEIRRLEDLVADLKTLLRNDEYPTEEQWESAPVILNAILQYHKEPCLGGLLIGGSGQTGLIKTSRLELLSRRGWARSMDSLYRLEFHD